MMDVDLIFKIAAIGILVSVLNQVLTRSGRDEMATMTTLVALVVVRKQSPEIALALGIGACALIVLYCSGALTAVMELVDKLAETGNLSAQVVEPVIKTAGIAIVTRLL